AWTATQPTTLATPGHHHPSLPPATATPGISLAITVMTTTSALVLAITPPMTATSAPAPAIPNTPPARAKTPIMHHRQSNLCMPCPAPALLLTTSLLHVSALPVQDLFATQHVSTPTTILHNPQVSPSAPVLQPTAGTQA
ncbi:hypothetical protein C0993_011004, partial [Termitomyces sp. T159_Od127]